MIKNMVFDMGNVLVSFDMPKYCERFADDPKDQRLLLEELFYSIEWAQTDRGTISIEDAIDRISARLPEHLKGKVGPMFYGWQQDSPHIPGMEKLIQRLKAAGYKIYLLSNTATLYYSFRHKLPAIDLFDGEFASADYKLLKPDQQIYHTFLRKFDLKAEECFFVDDMVANIEAAISVGFDGFVFKGDANALEETLVKKGLTF
ncbi:HAD family phosphatase [Eubacteriales bacterium OttesenSCG-928-K08]|nr:HAD family phosphatase [Eubacteriales bacterium OttesenSCG-928-K08]